MKFMQSVKSLVLAGWKYVLVALVVIAAGGYFFLGGSSKDGVSMTITPADFPTTVSVSGTVTAAQNVDLGFAASGRISGVYAAVGQHIGAGMVLAQVENGDLAAAVKEKQAELDSLRAGTRPEQIAIDQATVAGDQSALVDALQSAYTAADSAVHSTADQLFSNPRTNPKISFTTSNSAAKTAVENDRVALESTLALWKSSLASLTPGTAADAATSASTNLTQVATLLADANTALGAAQPDQATSQATLTSYINAIATARTSVNSAATAVSAAASALAAADKSLLLAQAGPTAADLAAAEAAVENAQAAFAKTLVVAPFAGVVTRFDAKTGEVVSPTDSQISMQSDGVFQIDTYIPEVSIAGVLAGDAATTTLDAYGPAVTFAAKVVSVDPAETVKDGVPTYKTTLVFRAADARIRSGMTANVVITTGVLSNAIVIPQGAVGHTASGQPYVSVLVNEQANNRPVTLGVSPSLGQVQITSGLTAGDAILLTPAP